jgi:hypothetical protein
MPRTAGTSRNPRCRTLGRRAAVPPARRGTSAARRRTVVVLSARAASLLPCLRNAYMATFSPLRAWDRAAGTRRRLQGRAPASSSLPAIRHRAQHAGVVATP